MELSKLSYVTHTPSLQKTQCLFQVDGPIKGPSNQSQGPMIPFIYSEFYLGKGTTVPLVLERVLRNAMAIFIFII